MQLDSVRELKASLQNTVLTTLAEAPRVRALGVAAGPITRSRSAEVRAVRSMSVISAASSNAPAKCRSLRSRAGCVRCGLAALSAISKSPPAHSAASSGHELIRQH